MFAHPDFVYRPLSAEQRKARSDAATIRIYGSLAKAKKTREKKLRRLIAERNKLSARLTIVRSHIVHLKRALS